MAAIGLQLIKRLQERLGVGQAAVYRRIERLVNNRHVPRRIAALLLASQHGINITRFATDADLATIRQITNASAAPQVVQLDPESRTPPRRGQSRAAGSRRRRGLETSVWVVHGRNVKVANELRKFLRALGLQPMEWNQAVRRTRQASPYVGTVLEKAFDAAAAVVVLLTPDDEARLRKRYWKAGEPGHETTLTPQARPNVLFEAGMAFGRDPKRTVLVQVGDVRPFSDIAGRHVVQLDESAQSRRQLATKLENAGCEVDTTGEDWLSHGDFGQSDGHTKRRSKARRRRKTRR